MRPSNRVPTRVPGLRCRPPRAGRWLLAPLLFSGTLAGACMKTQYLHPDGLPLESVSTLVWAPAMPARCGQDVRLVAIDGQPVASSKGWFNRAEVLPGQHTIVGAVNVSAFVDPGCAAADRPLPASPPANVGAKGEFTITSSTAVNGCYTAGAVLAKVEGSSKWSEIHLIDAWGTEVPTDTAARAACTRR